MERLSISLENIKLGKIPNISLPPIKTCVEHAPCAKYCYAYKSYHMYPVVRKAWDKNLRIYRENSRMYFKQLGEFLLTKRPEHFRFHVSGDIVDKQYLHSVLNLVEVCKDTRYLLFTKKYDLVLDELKKPIKSLTILFSTWPGMVAPETRFPIAWLDGLGETRIPSTAFPCTKKCTDCFMCWGTHNDVRLPLH